MKLACVEIHSQGAGCASSGFLYACPKVISAPGFVLLYSLQYLGFSLPFFPSPRLFPSLCSFSRTQPSGPLPPSPPARCAMPQPSGRGALLSPSETQHCDCLLLMSASPRHLGKEGKIHKRDGKYISFFVLFYFKKVEGRVLGLFDFS